MNQLISRMDIIPRLLQAQQIYFGLIKKHGYIPPILDFGDDITHIDAKVLIKDMMLSSIDDDTQYVNWAINDNGQLLQGQFYFDWLDCNLDADITQVYMQAIIDRVKHISNDLAILKDISNNL